MALQEDGGNLTERGVKRLELDLLPLSHGCQGPSHSRRYHPIQGRSSQQAPDILHPTNSDIV
jgi:hypothetical protein